MGVTEVGLTNNLAKDLFRIDAKGLADADELDHIEVTFTDFELRDEGLRTFQPIRQGTLSEARTQTLGGQNFSELGVFG